MDLEHDRDALDLEPTGHSSFDILGEAEKAVDDI